MQIIATKGVNIKQPDTSLNCTPRKNPNLLQCSAWNPSPGTLLK
jgi:hypothetical protein